MQGDIRGLAFILDSPVGTEKTAGLASDYDWVRNKPLCVAQAQWSKYVSQRPAGCFQLSITVSKEQHIDYMQLCC